MSPPSIVDISVIVLTADIEQNMLSECLASVLASSQAGKLSTEVILVDNASRSRICDWIAKEFQSITVLRFESIALDSPQGTTPATASPGAVISCS